MTRVYVIVEGQTEESFVANLLAPALWPHGIHLDAILLGVPGHKGGNPRYARVKRDLVTQLKQDRTAYCSTMLDLYGLGSDFPGSVSAGNLPGLQRAIRIEQAVKTQICADLPDLRPDIRLVPYIQLHEFEALLFSDPDAFAAGLKRPELAPELGVIRSACGGPEDIDDGRESAPSKRVLKLHRSYEKVVDGTVAAATVGIDAMARVSALPRLAEPLTRASRALT